MHYAQLDNKRDPGGGQSSEDPTRVQYASIDERRLVPVSDDIHVLVEDVPGVYCMCLNLLTQNNE